MGMNVARHGQATYSPEVFHRELHAYGGCGPELGMPGMTLRETTSRSYTGSSCRDSISIGMEERTARSFDSV